MSTLAPLSPAPDGIVGADLAALGPEGLSELQGAVRGADVPARELGAAMVRWSGVAADDPLARALLAICAAAERSGGAHPFHNPAHSREVALNWWLLAGVPANDQPALTPAQRLLGACAAFGHDLGHDGRGNVVAAVAGDTPLYQAFRLERVAAEQTAALLDAAGVAPAAIAVAVAMILVTDTGEGYRRLAAAPPPAGPFAPLAEPWVTAAALMLRDADLIPSGGMTLADYIARTGEMEMELGLEPGALSGEAAAAFFDDVVDGRFLSPAAAALLQPALDAIRDAAVRL